MWHLSGGICMINVVNKRPESINICVGTHNGIFHCDEVVAIAILAILTERFGDLSVIRSRDLELLANNTDLLVDVGNGKYDHHQKGGNGKRANGVMYASAGLIWKNFGDQVVSLFTNGKLSNDETMIVANIIDNEIIQNVDKEDNGKASIAHPFKFITSFLPSWDDEFPDFDKAFEQCVNYVIPILKEIIKTYIGLHLAKNEIFARLNNPETHIGNVLEIPCQTIPWKDEITRHNRYSKNKIDFVIFKYPAGGYALQCVPPSSKEKDQFLQRITLPEEWAGETTRLPEVSGVSSSTFCHTGRFFARANDRDGVIRMCQIATDKFLKQENTHKK